MTSREEQKIINDLTSNWIWVPDWNDSSPQSVNTAGRIVNFTKKTTLSSPPTSALLRFSADTRYKLYVNGKRVAVGPCRGSLSVWYYDTLDIAPFLHTGENEIKFVVLRYFASNRAALPFERSSLPGLTVIGFIDTGNANVDLSSTGEGWLAVVDESITFPTGLADDWCLHISERRDRSELRPVLSPNAYGIRTLNGDLAPWRLKPRPIPMPEESHCIVETILKSDSTISKEQWADFFERATSLTLPSDTSHTLELKADVHSTAFVKWKLKATQATQVRLKITYSEGYELEPRSYPFFRTKDDRLDVTNGHLIGPFDDVLLDISEDGTVIYEPFWFRTFRLIRFQVFVGTAPVELISFQAVQVNYPMAVKASWVNPEDPDSSAIWDVSIRTLQNCMFDAYSDCPFYEQLQYIGDSRTVAMFHYLLSGDDALMKVAIASFASSTTPEGLPQSRFPSHVPQVIAGFCLYWVLQVCDHHLFFGDAAFSRQSLPRIDGVLEFFENHVDELGLVSGLPYDVWQYVDWVTTWGATDSHPDKGVPSSGRESNRHTYFSMLYSYVLQQAAVLLKQIGRPAHVAEYEARSKALNAAVIKHCFDGRFFTDSTAAIAREGSYSQHCQIFAVLCGACPPSSASRLLTESFSDSRFSKCSYMMEFYALRAMSQCGDDTYNNYFKTVWDPWRKMLRQNLTTWEEDAVRQRSDCHAWGSVPIFEYCVEVAGLWPSKPGWSAVRWAPRLALTGQLDAKVALGKENIAAVRYWRQADVVHVELSLEKAVEVVSCLPGREEVSHGVVRTVELSWTPPN